MKKALSLLLCLFVILSVFTSCKKEEVTEDETETTVIENEEQEKEFTVSLGYYSHESLNPFSTESRTNKNISTLLYDSLFKVESDYEATEELAAGFEYEDGDLIVYLKEDILFTDGSTVSAEDVVYSFNQAKSAPLYKASLKNFKSARAQTENSVLFALYQPDIYAVSCLQFPVVKYASLAYDSPIGSGRYILKGKEKLYLSANADYCLDEILEQKRINLYDLNKTENPFYLLQIGELSFVYDDLSSDSLTYKINASTAEINLNNLIFLTFNKESEIFEDKRIKKAVCLSVDKSLLCGEIYDSLTVPAEAPFNPSWYVLQGYTPESTDEIKTPATLLDESGYIYEYDINEYRSKDFEYLKLSFLVSDGDEKKVALAKSITSALKKNGIDVALEIIEKDKFAATLEKGDYDMYLGEVKLTDDMSLSSFFTEGQRLSYGIDTSSACAKAYFDFREGKIDITTFVKVFNEYTPFLPICYKKGVAYYSRELKYEGAVSENDIFSNIYSWGK